IAAFRRRRGVYNWVFLLVHRWSWENIFLALALHVLSASAIIFLLISIRQLNSSTARKSGPGRRLVGGSGLGNLLL
ncbi:unnamed protein product, partial [Amoebophrya sp. A25]